MAYNRCNIRHWLDNKYYDNQPSHDSFRKLSAAYGKLVRNGFTECEDIEQWSGKLLDIAKRDKEGRLDGKQGPTTARVGARFYQYSVFEVKAGEYDSATEEVSTTARWASWTI